MLTSPSCTRIFEPCPIHDPAAQHKPRVAADLEPHARADEADSVGLQAPPVAELQQQQAREQAGVAEAQHAVGAHEAQQRERSSAQRPRSAALPGERTVGDPGCGVAVGVGHGVGESGLHRLQIVLAAGRPAMIAGAMTDPTLAERLLDGDRRALARAITLVENDRPEGWALVKEVYPHTGGATVIGFTGPPGAGKSTLIGALTKARRQAGRTVGVLSIDPSSPFTQGALLGDRIRLSEHFLDDGVFIRSMANRGALGGLSEAALQAALLLDAAGRQDVFVETVGVGQAEIDIIDHADTIVLVLMPGSGDSIQALKAGIMEIPDVIVINKADHPLTDTMVREIRGVLSLANLDRSTEEARRRWRVPIVRTEATHGKGIEELIERLEEHRAHILAEGRTGRATPAQPAQRDARDRDRPHAPAPGGGRARGPRVSEPARGGRRAAAGPGERGEPAARRARAAG